MMNPNFKNQSAWINHGFTLAEPLFMILIIAILAILDFWGTAKVRTMADKTNSIRNLSQLQIGNTWYAPGHNGDYVPIYANDDNGNAESCCFVEQDLLRILIGEVPDKSGEQSETVPLSLPDYKVVRPGSPVMTRFRYHLAWTAPASCFAGVQIFHSETANGDPRSPWRWTPKQKSRRFTEAYQATAGDLDRRGIGGIKAWFCDSRSPLKNKKSKTKCTWTIFSDNSPVGKIERKYLVDPLARPSLQVVAGRLDDFGFKFATRIQEIIFRMREATSRIGGFQRLQALQFHLNPSSISPVGALPTIRPHKCG